MLTGDFRGELKDEDRSRHDCFGGVWEIQGVQGALLFFFGRLATLVFFFWLGVNMGL